MSKTKCMNYTVNEFIYQINQNYISTYNVSHFLYIYSLLRRFFSIFFKLSSSFIFSFINVTKSFSSLAFNDT